jgi:hypothetical protein
MEFVILDLGQPYVPAWKQLIVKLLPFQFFMNWMLLLWKAKD